MLYFGKALELAKKINDRKQKLAALTNIGVLYSNMDIRDSAYLYLKLSDKLAKELNEQGLYAIIAYNLSHIFQGYGLFDSAYFYLNSSLIDVTI